MSAEPENFESLRKLLELKRHEQPPAGYFDHLAGEVRSRLMAGEHRQSDWWREMAEEASWLHRLWESVTARPALAGAFGMVVCGMVFGGIYFSQKPESESGVTALADVWKLQTPAAAVTVGQVSAPQLMASTTSTNPMMMTVPENASLFDQIGVPAQSSEVSFAPVGAR